MAGTKGPTEKSPLKARPDDSASDVPKEAPFPIVGIGASAGGLEALEQFLGQASPGCGLALVVVQHLDPTHKDLMVELLQRASRLPVVQIVDGMKVERDRIHVLPPNHDLSILHGVLHLLDPVAPRGLRLPIDHFFRALAEDQQERCIGVILSGMGSDGTIGARSIKEKAGAVFAQTAARFDSMPRSVMEAGLADMTAPAEELLGKILAYVHHVPLLATRENEAPEGADLGGLSKIIQLLRSRTGHDFTSYKKNSLHRRIGRRMALHQLPRIADYVRYLRENPQEADLLFRELLIGVTSFFRDPEVWEQLKAEALPGLLAAHPTGGTLRAWCPGCSTGEEAYSLAMVFHEALDLVRPDSHFSLQIFATDLDKDAIDRARTGAYTAGALEGVSKTRLRRFFEEDEGGFRVVKGIREMVIFAPQNLVMDPPFTKLDLLICRNLLIYLEADLQKRLMPLFHYSLSPGGLLMLGSAETVGQAPDLFLPLPGKTRLFWRQEGPPNMNRVEFPSSFVNILPQSSKHPAGASPAPSPTPLNLQALTDAVLLRHFAPAAVLTTGTGDIVYFHGKTGRYLEPPAGKANLNLFAMARGGLNTALDEAFFKVVRQRTSVTLRGVVVGTDGGGQGCDVTIQALTEPASLQGMVLVVFTEAAAPTQGKSFRKAGPASAPRLAALALELQHSREEMQSSQEELRSANEELQSTNEELQSTNEELTTSKEEMQSMNEELQTINHELQAKVNELSEAKDDMSNLLNSTDIATLFLDQMLRVRRFTPQTTSLFKLIPGDAGRPITDLVSELDYPGLAKDAKEVLRLLVPHEAQVPTRDGRWFTVRIRPYRTQDNRIDGVVIIFLDISSFILMQTSLYEAKTDLASSHTDRRDVLTRNRELEAALHKAEETLRTTLDDQGQGPAKPRKGVARKEGGRT